MPAPLSVVIPTLNAAADLAELLPQLMEGVAAGLVRDVIVSDGGSKDDIAKLAEAVGAEFVTGPAGRGGQLRRGVSASRADWILVLHADSRLPEGWSALVREAMEVPDRAFAFGLQFRATGLAPRLVAGWANLRSRFFALPYGDQGLLIPRALYEAAGGYPDIPLMEDVALVRALERPVQLLPAVISTSVDRYRADGWFRRGAGNLWLLLRYLAGADPARLAKAYSQRRDSGRS